MLKRRPGYLTARQAEWPQLGSLHWSLPRLDVDADLDGALGLVD